MIELTKKQYELAKILVDTGDSDKELAYKMGSSMPTIKMHLGNIKISVECQTGKRMTNRTQLVLFLLKEGFVCKAKEV